VCRISVLRGCHNGRGGAGRVCQLGGAGRVCQLGGACLSVGRGVCVSWAGRVCQLGGGATKLAHR
jgi:hypothetical protein